MAGHIDWDRALVPVSHWREVHRVMKDGAFAFIMSIPRQDLLARMIINLEKAGFRTNFSPIYWAFATGFPKSYDISKSIDKKPFAKHLKEFKVWLKHQISNCNKSTLEINRRCGFTATSYTRIDGKDYWTSAIPSTKKWKVMKKVIGIRDDYDWVINSYEEQRGYIDPTGNLHKSSGHSIEFSGKQLSSVPFSAEAKKYYGSYAGYQPAPALEVIIVCMKPMTEKTYVEQVLKNGKSITWLDDVRIPIPEDDLENYDYNRRGSYERVIHHRPIHEGGFKKLSSEDLPQMKGRFPSNLIVSDQVLDTGKEHKAGKYKGDGSGIGGLFQYPSSGKPAGREYGDSGGFSRYFDLDAWWEEKIKELPPEVQKTYPFWIVPKPSKSEKNKGCETLKNTVKVFKAGEARGGALVTKEVWGNYHQTTKPVRLFSYMITMGSREGDLILDPFLGSGTTVLACQFVKRKYLGIEKNRGYYTIARARAGFGKKNVKKLFKRKKKK